jgi:hypothetical protein
MPEAAEPGGHDRGVMFWPGNARLPSGEVTSVHLPVSPSGELFAHFGSETPRLTEVRSAETAAVAWQATITIGAGTFREVSRGRPGPVDSPLGNNMAPPVCSPDRPAAFAEAEIAGKTRSESSATHGREAVPVVGSGRELSACRPDHLAAVRPYDRTMAHASG